MEYSDALHIYISSAIKHAVVTFVNKIHNFNVFLYVYFSNTLVETPFVNPSTIQSFILSKKCNATIYTKVLCICVYVWVIYMDPDSMVITTLSHSPASRNVSNIVISLGLVSSSGCPWNNKLLSDYYKWSYTI